MEHNRWQRSKTAALQRAAAGGQQQEEREGPTGAAALRALVAALGSVGAAQARGLRPGPEGLRVEDS